MTKQKNYFHDMVINHQKSLIFLFYLSNLIVLISPELAYLIIFIFLFLQLFFYNIKLSYIKNYIKLNYFLFIIFITGFFFSFSNENLNILRDIFYFSTPIILLAFGYLLALRLKISDLFYHLIVCTVLIVVYQFFDFFILKGFNFQNNIEEFHSNNLFLIPLALSITLFNLKQASIHFKLYGKLIIFTLLIFSLLLTNQRAIYLSFFILILSNLDFFTIQNKLSLKKTFIAFIFIIFSISFIFVNGDQINNKFSNSIKEVTSTSFKNNKEKTIFWRAFESYKALELFNKSSINNQLFGAGFGKTIDLGAVFELKGTDFSSIIKIHNGYLNILIKTGIIGLTAIVLFYLKIIKDSIFVRRNDSEKKTFLKKIILGMSLILVLITAVVSGLLNVSGMFGFIIILGFLMKKNDLLNEKFI